MMKIITFKNCVFNLFFISGFVSAQVGINTTIPNATLDVASSPLEAEKVDGFIPPKLTGDELKAKDNLYDTNQIGAIVYVTELSSITTPKTIHVIEVGYYYFNGVEWKKMNTDITLSTASILSQTSVIAGIYGFTASGNDTNYLGTDLGANIRKVNWNNVRKENEEIITYNESDNSFTANKTGYFQFSINLVFRGAFTGNARLGLSRAYTGILTTAGNNTFSFLNQPTINADSSSPVTIYSSGAIYLTDGQKVSSLTRYITPATNTLNVEGIGYDRTLISSLVVTYFSTE